MHQLTSIKLTIHRRIILERASDIYERILEEGQKAIENFIIDRKSEELFLDFKRSRDNGNGNRLNDTDRNNLAKAISGFGNSEGGVVIWGVDCSKDEEGADVAKFKVPIENVKRFTSWLENAVSGCTIPPHSGVKNHPITIDNEGNGYVVTYIPKSDNAPFQMVGKLQYFIRAGSSFVPTPHQVLAGMFGRRPQPKVFLMYNVSPAEFLAHHLIRSKVGFLLRNQGPRVASDLYISVMVKSQLGSNCRLIFERADGENFAGQWSYGRHISLVSKEGVRLAPEAHILPLILTIHVEEPFDRP
jgi:hypothetical protein